MRLTAKSVGDHFAGAFILAAKLLEPCRIKFPELYCLVSLEGKYGRVSKVMLMERANSDRLFWMCEDLRNNLPEMWLAPHQKEWHNYVKVSNGIVAKPEVNSFYHPLSYSYRARNPLLRELIVPITLNSSGVRDTARVLPF